MTVRFAKKPLTAPFCGSETCPKQGSGRLEFGFKMTTIHNMLSPMGGLISSEQSRHPSFGPVYDPKNGAISGGFVYLTVKNGVPGVQECGSTPFVFCQKTRFFEDFHVFDSQICKIPTDGSILRRRNLSKYGISRHLKNGGGSPLNNFLGHPRDTPDTLFPKVMCPVVLWAWG